MNERTTTPVRTTPAITLPGNGLSAGLITNDGYQEPALPPHLLPLSDRSWVMWREVCLRGAGFPAVGALKLATPVGAGFADEVIMAEMTVQQALTEALDRVNEHLDALRQRGEWHRKAKRKPLLKALSALKKENVPPTSGFEQVDAACRAFDAAQQHLTSVYRQYETAFAEAITRMATHLIAIAQNDRFQEAIIWQNQTAFHTGVKPFLRQSSRRNSSQRQKEQLIANYWQRYCVKNDTIGFFGPVGWATIDPDQSEALTINCGDHLLRRRQIYFESWGIKALAARVAEDESLLPWLAPRPYPYLHLERMTLQLPGYKTQKLTPLQTAVLKACDGARLACEIARQIIKNPFYGLKDEAEVYAILKELRARDWIAWTLEIPFKGRPDVELRQRLNRVPKGAGRQTALQALAELEAARQKIEKTAGDPNQLDEAIHDLSQTFTRLTDTDATRNAGQIYAARTLVYEDCQRDTTVTIGAPILRELEPTLLLLLTSARWFTYEVAHLYRRLFKKMYRQLVALTGCTAVDLVTFQLQSQSILFINGQDLLNNLMTDLQQRWQSILKLPPNTRQVTYSSQRLYPQVQKLFAAPHPGWRTARYHSPDVMIAAESVEAVCQDDYQLIMGEFHIGTNTLAATLFVEQHPVPEMFTEAIAYDLGSPRVVPVVDSDNGFTTRTRPLLDTPNDHLLIFSGDTCGVPASQALPIGDLIVEAVEDDLIVRTRDRQLTFDIIDVFADALSATIGAHFQLLPSVTYQPRITIDRVIVGRETWRMPTDELSFAFEKTESDRFLAARRWAHIRALPRFLFVKSPVEEKPFYIDLESPVCIELLAKSIRQTNEESDTSQVITISEMMPKFNQLWLPDADGHRYTSEFRIVAVDQAERVERGT